METQQIVVVKWSFFAILNIAYGRFHTMTKSDRQSRIVAELRATPSCVSAAGTLLSVSTETVRRDLLNSMSVASSAAPMWGDAARRFRWRSPSAKVDGGWARGGAVAAQASRGK
jgi:hypothetical protein